MMAEKPGFLGVAGGVGGSSRVSAVEKLAMAPGVAGEESHLTIERVERRVGVVARSGDEAVLRGLGGAHASAGVSELSCRGWRGVRALRGVAGGVANGMGEGTSVCDKQPRG